MQTYWVTSGQTLINKMGNVAQKLSDCQANYVSEFCLPIEALCLLPAQCLTKKLLGFWSNPFLLLKSGVLAGEWGCCCAGLEMQKIKVGGRMGSREGEKGFLAKEHLGVKS